MNDPFVLANLTPGAVHTQDGSHQVGAVPGDADTDHRAAHARQASRRPAPDLAGRRRAAPGQLAPPSLRSGSAAIGRTDIHPHDLRHTAASLAIKAGANVKAVQQMLGHASVAMTLDVYAGLFEDDLDSVAAALDVLLTAATDDDETSD
jgi:integrase